MIKQIPTAKKSSFWQLIHQKSIEIPIIQRDYAQGRKNKEEIRNNFLDALYLSCREKIPIELDFIYGEIKKDRLQPLDGQQRLTTLFLLHWYAALKEGKLNEHKDLLQKFKYETRISSREFCDRLVVQAIDREMLLSANPGGNELSKAVIDSSWFFLSWKNDPTIKAMLIMLDAIHLKFVGCQGLWEKLTINNNITFQYIELENFGLSDDLYIKMNARGKPLTDFENFKAKFEKYLENNFHSLLSEFSKNIDGTWTDLFWNCRGEDGKVFDVAIMNFFRAMANNRVALLERPDAEEGIDLLRGNQPVSFSKYLDLGCFDETYCKEVIAILNKMAAGPLPPGKPTLYLKDFPWFDESGLFEGIIAGRPEYTELVLFHAYVQFLCKEPAVKENHGMFAEWARVVRNLVEGSRLSYYNDFREYISSIKGINDLLEHRTDIITFLSGIDTMQGFLGIQVAEEQIKANLFLKSTKWRNLIGRAENHPFFKGQIEFLLDFSGIKSADWNEDTDKINYAQFERYLYIAEKIFDKDGVALSGDFLFERALLAKGDYMGWKEKRSFYINGNDRDVSWKRYLRDNSSGRKVLKTLFDAVNPDTLAADLQSIVDGFQDKTSWRYYFVRYPELISICGQKKFIQWIDEYNILLLESYKTSAYHREYYSYALFLRLKACFSNLTYIQLRGRDSEKYFSIGDDLIWVWFADKKYRVQINPIDLIHNFDTQEETINFLEETGLLAR